jgi:hypothetical protein
MYVLFRAWRVNEGGTTDLPDYSEIVLGNQTLSTNLHGTCNGTCILLWVVKISPVSLILFRPGTILSSYRLMSIPTAFSKIDHVS